MTSFDSLGLEPSLLRVLAEVGYEAPTPIQARSIPPLLDGQDLLGIAQTGTGKTAAFALPLLQRLEPRKRAKPKHPQALVLAPTRELTVQIHTELEKLGASSSLRHGLVIGGVKENPQIRLLAKGVDVLVATPGRLLDLAANRHVDLGNVSMLVLDEADRLLDMGFVRDVRRIVAQTPDSRQSLLFSATMPKEVRSLAAEILTDPERVDVSPKQVTVAKIEQRVVHVETAEKQAVLESLLRDSSVERAIVFTRTKHGASRVAKKLVRAGIGAEAIHGNKSQNARQRALQSFRDGETWVLVATDIAARGLDIEGVSHVMNFELPHEPESYVHRIGRTGRAGAAGMAWSLVAPDEVKRLHAVERLTRERIAVGTLPQGSAAPRVNKPAAPAPARPSAAATGTENAGQGEPKKAKRRSRRRRKSDQPGKSQRLESVPKAPSADKEPSAKKESSAKPSRRRRSRSRRQAQ